MTPKRKLKQISNYDEKLNGSTKSNSNERKKQKNKGMKKTDIIEDLRVLYESNRWKKVFQLPSRGLKKVINTCLILARLITS